MHETGLKPVKMRTMNLTNRAEQAKKCLPSPEKGKIGDL